VVEVITILGCLIIAGIFLGLFSTGVIKVSSNNNTQTTQGSTHILYNMTTITFRPTGTFSLINQFNTSTTSVVQGAFTSTNGISVYVVPSAAMVNYTRYHTFATGRVASANLFITIPPGSWNLVIVNQGNTPTNVTITQAIQVVTLPSSSN
jgi:hypothetical protein